MKNTLLKVSSLFLAGIFILSLLPALIASASTIDSGKCGNNLTWTLTNTGTLTVSGSGEMTSTPWKDKYSSRIRTVIINSGVTSIEEEAFKDCTALNQVSIAGSVTGIGSHAFDNTAWYKAQADGLIYLGKVAYKYKGTMPKDTMVVIKNGTKGIAGSAFYQCKTLKRITIPESVTRIGAGAFQYCEALTNFTIPNNVTSIAARLFSGCISLTNVTIPYNVTSIGYAAFYRCSALTSIIVPNSVTSIEGNAFSFCTKLKNITIPNSVKSIGEDAFHNCTSLNNISIPDSVESIGYLAFEDCSALKSITIPSSVTNLGKQVFSGCFGLEKIVVDSKNTKYHSSGNCIIETAKKTLIAGCKNSIIPSDGSVTSIGNSAFMGCTSLTEIDIPKNVTSIGISAFFCCSSLTEIDIPKNVTSIGSSAFFCCSSLRTITIPTKVKSIEESTFYGCTDLVSIFLSDQVTKIGSSAFDKCSALKDVYYYGNENQWNRIAIENGNILLIDATIHFDWNLHKHSWDTGVITLQPTETTTGLKTFTCTICGAKKTEPIPVSSTINTEKAKENKNGIFVQVCVTASELKDVAGAGTKLNKAGGATVKDNENVGTGMVLTKTDGTKKMIIVYGDVNGDANITTADARLALRQAVNLEKYGKDTPQYYACNVDSEGDVTTSDARLILRAAVNLEDPNIWLK